MTAQLESIRCATLATAARLSDSVPADLGAIARRLGVVEISARPIDFDGYLARRQDGHLAIRYREGVPRARTRFTIAHEIGHILIANALGRRIEMPIARMEFRDDGEERLANRLAAELLLPERAVTAMFMESKPSWWTVHQIARLCATSVSTVVFRIGELDRLPYLQMRFKISAAGCLMSAPAFRARGLGRLLLCDPPAVIAERLLAELKSKAMAHSVHSLNLLTSNGIRRATLLGRKSFVTDRAYAEFITWGHGESNRGRTGTFPQLVKPCPNLNGEVRV